MSDGFSLSFIIASVLKRAFQFPEAGNSLIILYIQQGQGASGSLG
jgi:hypothetical protein